MSNEMVNHPAHYGGEDNVYEVISGGHYGLLNQYNDFIMEDMKWNGFKKVSALSEEIMTQYAEAYKALSK